MPSNNWRDVLLDALVVAGIYSKKHDTDPRLALHELLCWETSVVLDPAASSSAQELVDRGRKLQAAEDVVAFLNRDKTVTV